MALDKNKVNVDDMAKEMMNDPAQALKKDYEQTKADMENLKDKAEDTIEERFRRENR